MRSFFLAILFFPVIVEAQVIQRNLLQKNCPPGKLKQVLVSLDAFHPFPQIPAQWAAVLPDSMMHLIMKNGEDALKENFPPIPATVTLDFVRNGDRTRYENILFGKRNRLWNLALAESVEGKKRFIDAIVDGIWSIAEESFWGTSAHLFIQKEGSGLPNVEDPIVDLFAAETAATLAFVDYFVGPALETVSPLLRKRIYYEVNRRIFIPMQTAKYDWMGKGNINAKINNWAPWIMSNYLTAVLLLEKDPSKRVEYVSKAIQLTDQYINGFGEDGACEEGPHYWSFGTACVLDVLDLLSSASNNSINIYKEPIIRNMGAYIYRTHIAGNYYVDVADSHPEVFPESITVWRFGNAGNNDTLGSFGAWLYRNGGNTINPTFHRSRGMYDMLHLKSIAADRSIFHESESSWMPDVQMMTQRFPNGLFIAAHGGHNGESHNHNDVGDFIVYADGDPVIVDVGSGTYTAKTFSKDRYNIWFNASGHHNLPTINEKQQSEGIAYAAGDVSYKSLNGRISLSMNIEKAYPPEANLKQWKRIITADKSSITINDKFLGNKTATSLTQTFMTVCEADLTQPGKIIFSTEHGKKVLLQYGKEWQVLKEPMNLVSEEEQGLKYTWRNQPITRILLTLKSPATIKEFRYVISRL